MIQNWTLSCLSTILGFQYLNCSKDKQMIPPTPTSHPHPLALLKWFLVYACKVFSAVGVCTQCKNSCPRNAIKVTGIERRGIHYLKGLQTGHSKSKFLNQAIALHYSCGLDSQLIVILFMYCEVAHHRFSPQILSSCLIYMFCCSFILPYLNEKLIILCI